ncbi:hypothetical protein R3W88_030276 [Solanum pinnatisectum]|uniref:Disease resistance protein n=1 Tax=Solanum pinnatisectum TaxID=50273 RepID=A0AAV9K7N1_9SOLN|nr:hypothetical protein R3W88_030276 [Solanum pinnatisectum]
MRYLEIWGCKKLKCLPEIELFNLQVLEIYNCKELVNGRKQWCLQRFPCLTNLWITHDGSDEEIQHWELPSSIKTLHVSNLKTLSSQVLKSLTSLEYLYIALHLCYHDELHSLHLCHLTSLKRLHLNCRNLQLLSESTLLCSLSQLTIKNCDNLQSLSMSTLPSSLSQLIIIRCRNLQSLSESALPSSLSQLEIYDCPNLQSLPINGMTSSLFKLRISNCPLLTPLLEFDKGKYWPNIGQIPIIQIDWKHL